MKTVGLKYLQFPVMGGSGEPPDRRRGVNNSSDKLLIQQSSISCSQIISPIQKIPAIPDCVAFFSSVRYESTRAKLYQGSPLDNGQHQLNGFAARRAADPVFRDPPTGLSEEHDGARRVAGDPSFSQPPPNLAELSLQVVDEQRWLTRRDYDSRVVCVESQVDMAGRRRHVVDIQTEQDGTYYSSLIHASPHATTSRCGCLEDTANIRPCR